MKIINNYQPLTRNLWALALCFALYSGVTAQADADRKEPVLPAGCSVIEAPAGNKLSFQTYALGVQIYRWNGSAWVFVAPQANLYADAGFLGQVGTHYEGPTWESNSGGTVVAGRVDGCTPETSAIPWLLLKMVSTDGKGPFGKTIYIQRVNTVGGLPPSAPGTFAGQEQRIPYTAEYFFYRAEN